MIKRHQEELRMLHQKLDLHSDTSLDRFKQTAVVRMYPFVSVSLFLFKQLWLVELRLTTTVVYVKSMTSDSH